LYGICVVNLRFFTVYGPRQRPDLAIHKFFKLLNQNKPIDIFGDGSTGRDYTFIDDIVDGILAASQYIQSKDAVYEIINLGNSSPVKLNQLIDNIEKIAGKQFEKRYLPMQEGDVDLTFADISKAQKMLGYQPKISLEMGLTLFKNWLESN
jgi:nucleoside-diphosphate-sugar epimerase